MSKIEFIFWSTLWVIVIIVAFLPGITNAFAFVLGIGRGVDILTYMSIILLFYLIFRLYVKLEDQSHDFTKLVRDLAIGRKK